MFLINKINILGYNVYTKVNEEEEYQKKEVIKKQEEKYNERVEEYWAKISVKEQYHRDFSNREYQKIKIYIEKKKTEIEKYDEENDDELLNIKLLYLAKMRELPLVLKDYSEGLGDKMFKWDL